MTFLIASITPVIIFLYLIFRKDARPEPLPLLAKCFFGGFLSVVLTLLVGSLMQTELADPSSPFSNAIYQSFVLASIPEEVSKWIVLYWLVMKSDHFDEHYDGIQYAVFVSLGFALVENVLYVFEGGLTVAFFRGVLAVPGHGFFAVLMGYFLSQARLGVARNCIVARNCNCGLLGKIRQHLKTDQQTYTKESISLVNQQDDV